MHFGNRHTGAWKTAGQTVVNATPGALQSCCRAVTVLVLPVCGFKSRKTRGLRAGCSFWHHQANEHIYIAGSNLLRTPCLTRTSLQRGRLLDNKGVECYARRTSEPLLSCAQSLMRQHKPRSLCCVSWKESALRIVC